jgi:predicted permease
MSSGSSGDQEQVLFDNLVPALLQTCTLVLLGYGSNRYDLMPIHSASVLGAFAATFALPALCFLSMAELDLGNASIGLPLGMLAAKVSVALLVGLLTLYLAPRDGSDENHRIGSLSALFSMVTVSSNDYALGLPIIDALYPSPVAAEQCPHGETEVVGEVEFRMRDYVWLFSPITLLVINPVCFAILEAEAAGASKNRRPPGTACCFIMKQVLLPTLTNPVVFCVAAGLVVNLLGLGLPRFAADSLDTIGAAFSSISLFCLGMSMHITADIVTAEEVGGEAPAGDVKATPALNSEMGQGRASVGGQWIQALLLIAAKSLLLPIVARFLVLEITEDEMLSRFAFIYATFPPSTQTYIFALKFGTSGASRSPPCSGRWSRPRSSLARPRWR